jgi:hypothetical protein
MGKKDKRNAGRRKKGFFIFAGIILAAAVFVGYVVLKGDSGEEQTAGEPWRHHVPCINPALPIPAQYHIHPVLKIIADGKPIPVPKNIGIAFRCEKAVHTHDETGTIHVEPNVYVPFSLGDFFDVWEKPFNRDQILDFKRDGNHEIVMTVDGSASEEFEKLMLKDKQQIVIEYREIKEKFAP